LRFVNVICFLTIPPYLERTRKGRRAMNTYKKNMMSIAIALLLSGTTLSGAKASAAAGLQKTDSAEIGQPYTDDKDVADKE
jgi:hypothetical protein